MKNKYNYFLNYFFCISLIFFLSSCGGGGGGGGAGSSGGSGSSGVEAVTFIIGTLCPPLEVTTIEAGGKGTRLEPFTKILPKPLVPIHEKPVIEHIIERFTDVGINEFILSVNYKARIMKAFFEELDHDYLIKFVEEEKPLGTAGSLKLLEAKINKPFMMTNCDIIIKTDYPDLYSFHEENNYEITLVASMKNYTIPYGTCELNSDGYLSNINEKPQYDFLINTGLYVLNPSVLKLIPKVFAACVLLP